MNITKCNIGHCTSRDGGTIYVKNNAHVELNRVTLRHNRALQNGGAIKCKNGRVTFTGNNSLYNNIALSQGGGGSFTDGCNVRIQNDVNDTESCTFIEANTAVSGGGGVAFTSHDYEEQTMENPSSSKGDLVCMSKKIKRFENIATFNVFIGCRRGRNIQYAGGEHCKERVMLSLSKFWR